jgi:cell division transport system permease protein
VQGYLAVNIPLTSFVGLGEALIIVPALLVIGCLLAAVSANFAITRYLKI